MIAFWVVAGVLSFAAAGLILVNAARAARTAGPDDPTVAVYRRQLDEIDDLAARGLIPEGERKTAHAEAARRLLAAVDRSEESWSADAGVRKGVLVAAVLGPLAAVGVYLATGAPGMPDQPLDARIEAWRQADPSTLAPQQLAVLLRDLIRERPEDPEAYRFLALAESASDNPAAAARALRRALALSPERADLWEQLGQAIVVENAGDVTPEAQAAFERALARDPRSPAARFHMARARAAGGDPAGAKAALAALLKDLPDPESQAAVRRQIAEIDGRPASAGAPPMEAIRGMVAGLAARLQTNPDDPEGWVRLVRSYAVLGQAGERDAALAAARKRYASDPQVLQALDAAAKTEPMR
jgi:cytochrome c-type biogenesis protein CcmH